MLQLLVTTVLLQHKVADKALLQVEVLQQLEQPEEVVEVHLPQDNVISKR